MDGVFDVGWIICECFSGCFGKNTLCLKIQINEIEN